MGTLGAYKPQASGGDESPGTLGDEPSRPCNKGCGRPVANTSYRTQYMCKPCWSEYTRKKAMAAYQRNYELMAGIMGNACYDCGVTRTARKRLQFMYWANPDTGDDRAPGRFLQSSEEVVLRQLKWCDLLCHSCRQSRVNSGVIPLNASLYMKREKALMLAGIYLLPYDGLRMDEEDNTLG